MQPELMGGVLLGEGKGEKGNTERPLGREGEKGRWREREKQRDEEKRKHVEFCLLF